MQDKENSMYGKIRDVHWMHTNASIIVTVTLVQCLYGSKPNQQWGI